MLGTKGSVGVAVLSVSRTSRSKKRFDLSVARRSSLLKDSHTLPTPVFKVLEFFQCLIYSPSLVIDFGNETRGINLGMSDFGHNVKKQGR